MAKDDEPHSCEPSEGQPALSPDEDDAFLAAREAIGDGTLEYIDKKLRDSGNTELFAEFLCEGLLVTTLKLIGPNGTYAMDQGRFWQILDRYCPFMPLGGEDSIRVRLVSEIEALFAAAGSETFEDGFDSVLSLELQRLVLRRGEMTLEIISDLVLGDRIAAEVAAEILRCLGEMDNQATHKARRQLLERCLACSSHVTRDGAVVGLSDLNDPGAIPAIETAAAREDYRLLRANMCAILERLKGAQP